MSSAPERIQADALALPVADRARLAHRLLESLDEDVVEDPAAVAEAWEAEITRRIADYQSGQAETHTAANVVADARSRMKRP